MVTSETITGFVQVMVNPEGHEIPWSSRPEKSWNLSLGHEKEQKLYSKSNKAMNILLIWSFPLYFGSNISIVGHEKYQRGPRQHGKQ